MRLINVSTFKLEEYNGSGIPKYAILSHTWGKDEVSFAEFETPEAQHRAQDKAGYDKILRFCRRAEKDGHRHVWADSVCIDKRSSSELTEAINSMFKWYQKADVCYAYLSDVSGSNFQQCIPRSRWFTRGWTLQELLAPRNLIFIDQDFNVSCSREFVAHSVSEVTGIEEDLLEYNSVNRIRGQSIAKRISWAARRVTTRIEDQAYSLLGIFGINMPLLYGEGPKAFQRLQEEIIKRSDDQTIFAFELKTHRTNSDSGSTVMDSLNPGHYLASSPFSFADSGDIEPMPHDPSRIESTVITNLGLQIHLPILPTRQRANDKDSDAQQHQIALLNCRRASDGSYIGMMISSGEFTDSRPEVSKSMRSRLIGVSGGFIAEATVTVNHDIIGEARYATLVLRSKSGPYEMRNFYPSWDTLEQVHWTLCCRYFGLQPWSDFLENWQMERVDALAYHNLARFSVIYPVDVDFEHPDEEEYNCTFKLSAKESNKPHALLLVFRHLVHKRTIELILLEPFAEVSGEIQISRVDGAGGRSATIKRLQRWNGGWEPLIEGSTSLHGSTYERTTVNIKFADLKILDQRCIDLEIRIEDLK